MINLLNENLIQILLIDLLILKSIEYSMDLLAERITQSINDLGLQIDILYKLNENDRQHYLYKIQIFKNALLNFKSTLKISNKEFIENQFKNIRSQILEMKRLIQAKLEEIRSKSINKQNRSIHQNRLNSRKFCFSKETTSKGHETQLQPSQVLFHTQNLFDESLMSKSQVKGSRIGVMKHINKRQYEDLMKSIVDKAQKSKKLQQQIALVKKQNQQLKQSNQQLLEKVTLHQTQKQAFLLEINSLKSQLHDTRNKVHQMEPELASLKTEDLSKTAKFSQSALEINRLRNQIDFLNQKLFNRANFEELNSFKQSMLEQDIQKYNNQIKLLNQQHQIELNKLNHKIKQLSKYEPLHLQLSSKASKLQLLLENQNQDMQVLSSELTNAQKLFYSLKIQKQSAESHLDLYMQKQQRNLKQLQKMKQMLIDSEKLNSTKQMQINQLKVRLSKYQQNYLEERHSTQSLQDKLIVKQQQFQKQRSSYICDIQLKKIQIDKLSDQVKKSLELIKTLQDEINQNYFNRTKIRDDNKLLSKDLKDIQIKNIQLEKKLTELQTIYFNTLEKLNSREGQLELAKNSVLNLQTQLKQTKIRLHKAKIEAIHDIRNTLF